MSGKVGDNVYRASGVVASSSSEYDDNQVQSNIAMLGFKVAINGSLAKYNLVDQAIDEYEDTSGVDASASSNDRRDGSAGAYYYDGAVDQGNAGGINSASGAFSGGGGGAGAVGGDGVSGTKGGDGGAGLSSSIDGSATYRGGGGGAAEHWLHGAIGVGGTGGGGDGGGRAGSPGAGTANTGGGGGGADATSKGGNVGGAGGSGIVILRRLTGTGITTSSTGSVASEGTVDGDYTWYKWTTTQSDGTFTTDTTQDMEYLVIAGGGGGGGHHYSAGGGAGGYRTATGFSVAAGTITGITVGAGGAGGTAQVDGSDGSNSVFSTISTTGGGGGAANQGGNGRDGGSGGGASGAGNTGGVGTTTTDDLTLQSTDTTASTANPDYGELVCLIENAEGTATLNTDIKGYVSEDSGVTFTEGTFVDEGSWGTNKKIIAFHDLDISAQSGSSMCYKITTHNQEASSLETRIYATSIGWR